MKVLVYNPLAAVWRPRLPAVLSVTQELIERGDEVVYIDCDGRVPACTANLDRSEAICRFCVARSDKGLGLLSGRFRRQSLVDYLDPARASELQGLDDGIQTVEELRALQHRGADVGYAAYSSYAYVARKSQPNLAHPAVRRTIQRLVNTGRLVYEAIANALRKEQPERVILYHGRSDIDRPALRACQHAGIESYVYENAFGVNRLVRFKNALPQDFAAFSGAIDELWEQAPEDKLEIARAFFEMRRGGKRSVKAGSATLTTQDPVYVRDQVQGQLPEGWRAERKNVVVYGTSNDEFIAISPEYEESLYSSQIDALEQISASLADDPAIHIYFRIHPRQKGVEDDYTRGLTRVGRERTNVTIVPADSAVSSYALLDGAAVALSFRSTMSIESTFWDKPSIVLSASIYKCLGATYNPTSHAEVLELIRSDLPPKDKLPALKAGYYLMRSGFTHPYFTSDTAQGRSGYAFRGDPIRVGGLTRLSYLLSRERQRIKWRRMI